jgi:hypothetical protein
LLCVQGPAQEQPAKPDAQDDQKSTERDYRLMMWFVENETLVGFHVYLVFVGT